jgi:histidyl-tRNA synthetase
VSDPIAKFFFIGPMFRYEKPQKGRYRQFHQIDAETLGSADPRTDAEFIELLRRFFFEVGLFDLEFQVNTLGCPGCRPAFKKALQQFLVDRISSLCDDCHRRLERNPLRIYDCKVDTCQKILEGAPVMSSFVCEECGDHFRELQDHLSLLEVPYIVNERIVRGLDYYTKTTFEVIAHGLGAQNAVCGGGRYDMLMKDLGGPDLPGIGFAIGMERVVSMVKDTPYGRNERGDLFVAALGPEAERRGFQIVHEMRRRGFRAEMDYQKRSLKAQMRRADKLVMRFVLILGENEISTGKAILRDMVTKQQNEISLDGIEGLLEPFLKGSDSQKTKDS